MNTDNPFSSKDGYHDIRWYSCSTSDGKGALFSLIASHGESFCWSYEYLKSFLSERNETYAWAGDPNYIQLTKIPSPLEFLEILEFRLSQLARAEEDPDATWEWPLEWAVTWNGPILRRWRAPNDHLLNVKSFDLLEAERLETLRAIEVHKRLMGHLLPVPDLQDDVRVLESALCSILFTAQEFNDGGQGTMFRRRRELGNSFVFGSFDSPRFRCSNCDHPPDYDDYLGLYKFQGIAVDPWLWPHKRHSSIYLLLRPIEQVARYFGLQPEVLTRLVLLHELAHWILHELPDRSGNAWPEANSVAASPDIHECLAQLLAWWAIEDTKDGEAQHAFELLAQHQSPPYRRYQELVSRTRERERIIGAIPHLRQTLTPPLFSAWILTV